MKCVRRVKHVHRSAALRCQWNTFLSFQYVSCSLMKRARKNRDFDHLHPLEPSCAQQPSAASQVETMRQQREHAEQNDVYPIYKASGCPASTFSLHVRVFKSGWNNCIYSFAASEDPISRLVVLHILMPSRKLPCQYFRTSTLLHSQVDRDIARLRCDKLKNGFEAMKNDSRVTRVVHLIIHT